MTKAISSVRHFAHVHDDLPAFHAGYLVLTLLVAALLNMGAFVMLIVIHMALDFVKYREYHHFTLKRTFEGMLRESLVDIALVSVGLLFAVYLKHTVGLASLSGLLRAEVTLVSAALLLVPKVTILHDFLKIVSHLHHYIDQVHPRLHKGWSDLDHFCFFAIEFSFILIAASPFIMRTHPDSILHILSKELILFAF